MESSTPRKTFPHLAFYCLHRNLGMFFSLVSQSKNFSFAALDLASGSAVEVSLLGFLLVQSLLCVYGVVVGCRLRPMSEDCFMVFAALKFVSETSSTENKYERKGIRKQK